MAARGKAERHGRQVFQCERGIILQKPGIGGKNGNNFFFPAEEDFKVILMDRGNTQNSQFRNTAQELLGLFCNAAFVDFIINQWKQAVKRLQTGFDKDFRPVR